MDFRTLKPDEIECRVSRIKDKDGHATGIFLLLYKTARTDSGILDETVGSENWQDKFYECKGNLYCSVGIKCGAEWVWKDDCGSESNMEKEKGEASDAFKRACFKWGIGKELYTSPQIFVAADYCKTLNKDSYGKWVCYDRFIVSDIGYDENRRIDQLVLRNPYSDQIVYSFGRALGGQK